MNCRELAERHAETALANFGKDGNLTPAILLLNREQEHVATVMPVLSKETNGMAGALGHIVPLLGILFETQWVVIISETWIYETQDVEVMHSIRRGELEERALSGDQTVHTGILVSAFDLFDLDDSLTLTYNTDRAFQRHVVEGPGAGEIGDTIRWCSERLQEELATRPSGKVPMFLVQMMLDHMKDYITAAMIYGGVLEDLTSLNVVVNDE